MLRILLADDQWWLRSALRLLLEHEPDTEVVGEVADVDTLLPRVLATHPNLVILDWELPGLGSIETVRHLFDTLHTQSPSVRIVVMSGHPNAGQIAQAAGADYFISKAKPPDLLLSTLRSMHDLP